MLFRDAVTSRLNELISFDLAELYSRFTLIFELRLIAVSILLATKVSTQF